MQPCSRVSPRPRPSLLDRGLSFCEGAHVAQHHRRASRKTASPKAIKRRRRCAAFESRSKYSRGARDCTTRQNAADHSPIGHRFLPRYFPGNPSSPPCLAGYNSGVVAPWLRPISIRRSVRMRNIEQIFLPSAANILMGQHMRVVHMHASQPTIQTKFPIARRSCPICGKDMRVTRITPERPSFEQRTLECATCGDETILMDPIRYGRETPWNPR
jgi:rRNA maturation protein Nop10